MHSHYYSLFPNSQDPHPPLFEDTGSPRAASEASRSSASEEGEEVIEQELLKKTSELHEALRNIKLLRFQLIESRIMHKRNLDKANQLELQIAAAGQTNADLHEQNHELEKELKLIAQKVQQQRDKNRASYRNLNLVESQLNQAKLRLRGLASQDEPALHDKENVSSHANRFISIEKIALEAQNSGSREILQVIKQEIAHAKAKLGEAEAKKHQMTEEYALLVAQLRQPEGHKPESKGRQPEKRKAKLL